MPGFAALSAFVAIAGSDGAVWFAELARPAIGTRAL